MLGLMQDWPLRLHRIIDHAARHHAGRDIVSRPTEGPTLRTTYPEIRARALRLAQRLARAGVRPGERVATMAWNTHRHLECWFGIAGMGAIYHTVNPRLFPDQIAWILNHAESRMLFLDLSFVAQLEAMQDRLPHITQYVILTDAAHLPPTALRGAVAYEDWIAEADGDAAWTDGDENAACALCYTSGTTGDPKGVLYSHRALVMHAMMALQPDVFGLSVADRAAPVSSMFHANAWVMPYSAAMVGAALLLPGRHLDGAALHRFFEEERASITCGVPTVWMMLLQYLEATGGRLSTLKRILCGGSAVPRALHQAYLERHGVRILHAWGMTEMSPIGTCGGAVKPEHAALDSEARLDLAAKHGFPPFTVDMKITDDEGRELPWDGKTFGRLKVAGPAVVKGYFRAPDAASIDAQGFFDSGDVATIDPHGTMEITDRSKDLIKSGGEWISSIALENLAMAHPDVAEAAVVAVAHPKWDERPLLVVVPRPGAAPPSREALLDFLRPQVAKWWLPDDVVLVDEIPHTATGKIEKKALRARFRDHNPAGAPAA